mgnify:CR=1 FL=1
MSDNNNDTGNDVFWQKLKQMGYTDYDIKTKQYIFSLFINFSLLTKFRTREGEELLRLLEQDTLSDEEWRTLVKEKWIDAGISLSNDVN